MRSQKNRRKEKLMSCVTWHLLLLGRGRTGVSVCVCLCTCERGMRLWCMFTWFIAACPLLLLQHYPTDTTTQQVKVRIQRWEWKWIRWMKSIWFDLWCQVIIFRKCFCFSFLSLFQPCWLSLPILHTLFIPLKWENVREIRAVKTEAAEVETLTLPCLHG